jgi:tetratricopeptide (TPR) repeat protein
MSDNTRVDELLKDLLNSGGTPEEVCRTCPELLPQVRAGWLRLRALKTEVNALFHEFPFSTGGPSSPLPTAELPRIRGYEVREVLGRGGMGIVYMAWHLRLQRTVAVKMLLAGAYAQPHELERFLREAETVASLRHANIVQAHEAGDVDGRPYFTMEFVEGGTLAQKLAGTPQPAEQAAALMAVVAEAVHAAHQRGVVHRDLKPGNILLTADGAPKISDFGLARQLEGAAGLTQSGAPVGTPSYMAPEQAEGKSRDVGPAADTYALGAILHELLTGRPPFRAETAAQTLRQVIAQDPVPPSRLNACVPRDLETICLKCLSKQPQSRYATAAALSEDLRRFLGGEAIMARPLGPLERLVRWVRRRPTAAALSGALLVAALLALVLVGSTLRLSGQWQATERAAEQDLREVERLLRSDNNTDLAWRARAALESAKARLGAGGSPSLQERIAQAEQTLKLLDHLDAIRMERCANFGRLFDRRQSDHAYEEAFASTGLGTPAEAAEVVAARINASLAPQALIAALDDWAICVADNERREWLLRVARLSDPHPWRDRVRDPAAWVDPAKLTDLARTAPTQEQSVQLLAALGERMNRVKLDAVPFLRNVQQKHPGDFYANYWLGEALLAKQQPAAAMGFFRTALALRPRSATASFCLALALARQSLTDEALVYYQQAIDLDPQDAESHARFAGVLRDKGRLDDALHHYRQALRLDPKANWVRDNAGREMGLLLVEMGQLDDAISHLRHVVTLAPLDSQAQAGLRTALIRQGRPEEALTAWRKALDAGSVEDSDWFGYAELCLFLGHEDEYRRHRRTLLVRIDDATNPSVAQACLLLPGTKEELEGAAALVDRVLAAQPKAAWDRPFNRFLRGLAAYRLGRFDDAITTLASGEAANSPPSNHLITAMALHQKGQKGQALKTLAAVSSSFDWTAPRAEIGSARIPYILRREAAMLILPNLPAFMEDRYQPQEHDERLALLGACQDTNRCLALARLYTDIFRADPSLAEDLAVRHRYNAARAAAQAGCGLGKDSAGLGELERKKWRAQAHTWLGEDLADQEKRAALPDAAAGDDAIGWFRRLKQDSDFDGVRDAKALAQLDESERLQWQQFWQAVDAKLKKVQTFGGGAGPDPSLKPTFGSVKLKAGFKNDPYTSELVAGGELRTDKGGVKGFVARAPGFVLDYEAGTNVLTIHAVSKEDTTLLIQLPDGTWLANDDRSQNNLNPLLRFAKPQSGRYTIWVGTYNSPNAQATLAITEKEVGD